MKFQIRIFLVFNMLFLLVACASVEQRRAYFSETQDGYIGRSIEDYLIAKPVSIDYEGNEVIYNYANNEIGCKWALIIDEKFKVIKQWKYISDPDRCYEQINWRGPW